MTQRGSPAPGANTYLYINICIIHAYIQKVHFEQIGKSMLIYRVIPSMYYGFCRLCCSQNV